MFFQGLLQSRCVNYVSIDIILSGKAITWATNPPTWMIRVWPSFDTHLFAGPAKETLPVATLLISYVLKFLYSQPATRKTLVADSKTKP
jgi:hypothetical protein